MCPAHAQAPRPVTPVILASQSPRRRELLERLGVVPTVIGPPADFDAESLETVTPGEPPRDYVLRVAKNKRAAFVDLIDRDKIAVPAHGVLLTADTTVAINQQILGKPDTREAAIAMLRALSGRCHEVFTAVAVIHLRSRAHQEIVVRTEVEFAPLTEAWISNYVASGEPMDKAGSYGIQGPAGIMIPRINGSVSAVMGLPLYETRVLLETLGVSLDPLH